MATLKLNTTSGGSITLAPTDTASNVTISLPAAANGTLLTSNQFQTELSSAIGVSVQGYDATTLKSADIGVTVQGYDATTLKSADIGVSVQGYDADLAAFAAKTAPTGAVVGTTDTQTLSAKTITGLRQTRVAMPANDIDLSAGNYFTKTISTTTTFTVSNTPTTGTVASFILDLTNGASATINWWSNLKWVAGTAPTLTAAGRDTLGFFTHDAGTTWTGLVLGKDIK